MRMWKIWLTAGAVGVASLAGVIFFGLRAVDSGAEPPPPAPVSKEFTWAERASALCSTSVDAVRVALTSSARAGESNAERAARLYVETTAIEGRLVSSLRLLRAPADTAKVNEAIRRLEKQHDEDVLVGRRLERRFDEALLRQAILAYEREATRLRRAFRALGASGCVRYFDPATYE